MAGAGICDTETSAGYLILGIKGETATYVDVPTGVWQNFKQADSLGQFFTREIKGKYECEEGEPLWTRHDSVAVESVAASLLRVVITSRQPPAFRIGKT